MPLYSHYPHAEIAAGRHDVPPSAPDAERFVREADIGDGWLHPYASNYTFVVRLSLDEQEGCGVYKPQTGERPLWDFPTGTLAHRECATYELARALGWGLVPPTVLREGEADEGSLQLFVPHDPDSNFFTLRDEHPKRRSASQSSTCSRTTPTAREGTASWGRTVACGPSTTG